VYILDSLKDIVVENANGGTDTIVTSTSYALGANFEELVLTSSGNVNGTGNTLDNVIYGYDGKNKLDGGAGNDTLLGGDDNDLLLGKGGDDILIGEAGDDDMRGGLGNDIYYVDDAGDKVTELFGQGRDRIMSGITVDLALVGANVEDLFLTGVLDVDGLGNNLGNFIFGSTGKNLLNGRGGNDVLVDVAGQNTLLGGAGNDDLSGGGDADTLDGGTGDDTLNGGGGTDILKGGKGNDTYVLSDGFETLTEEASEGIDLVLSRFDHTLGANFENLTLTGKDSIGGTGNEIANIITGNNASNTLYGDAGNDILIGKGGQDVLNGGAGGDTMRGGTGSDLYYVDSVADKVFESFNQGYDYVVTTLSSYTLGANVEGVDFTGPGNAIGTGNALANEIAGDVGNDRLDGRAGNDVLSGGDGNDRLIGGLGNDFLGGSDGNDTLVGGAGDDALFGDFGKDVMIGGAGNDRYMVYEADDVVQEAVNGGTDLVFTQISMTLGANVENAELLVGNLTVKGNDLNNRILGSDGSDTISGGKGADTLLGRAGNDDITCGAGNDVVVGGLGADTIDAGAGNDVIRYAIDAPADLNNLGGDVITGFEHGKDRINLYDLFSDFDIRTEDVVGKGFLQLFVSGNDTLVLFDSDGGGDTFVTLATLKDVTNVTLTDVIYQQGPIVD
jgi:Ca2+-binding RTX toxin-like protein